MIFSFTIMFISYFLKFVTFRLVKDEHIEDASLIIQYYSPETIL